MPRFLLHKLLPFCALCLAAASALAAEITALRSWRAPDNTRLVLDLSAPVQFQLSPDSTPARLVVDIDGAQTAGPLALPAVQPPLKALHLEKTARGQRLVIDTALELQPRIFQLPPNEKYGHRLVLDLYDKPAAAAERPLRTAEAAAVMAVPVQPAPVAEAKTAADGEAVATALPPPEPRVAPPESPDRATPGRAAGPEKSDARRYRNIIVAIDAGHGGEDPGAIGQNGTYEKNVTLAIARELYDKLAAEPGITPVLTRTGDYFIPLQERRRMARYQHKADIFISIHADSAESRAARGASVFALSLKGAGTATSRFARMLAERENRSDLIGGAALERDDDILRNVLADMVVAGSLEHSLHMGRHILQGLERIGTLHSAQVEQAGFAVLKEPGMVSLLVETGFISNPDEEKRLTSRQYQQEVAAAVAAGVRRYCVQFPAPATYFAWLAEQGRTADRGERLAVRDKAARSAPDHAQAPPAPVLVAAKAASHPNGPRYLTHKVRRGENLTRLAGQYQVSMAALRAANHLRDDNVKIGQTLKIPVN